MSGDDLTIFLFFVTCAIAFALESVKTEAGIRRTSFGAIALLCLLTGAFWLRIEAAWPALSQQIAAVATNPMSWFVIIMFMLAVFAFQPPRQHRPGPIAPLRDAPIKKEDEGPREFLQVSPEYLIAFRNDPKYTRVQSDRIIAPYLGKWMKVEGPIRDIYPSFLTIRIPQPTENNPDGYFNIYLSFEESQAQRFHSLGVGQKIRVTGKLRGVNYSAIDLELGELES